MLLWLSLSGSDLVDDPRVVRELAAMLRDARYGYGPERAAFQDDLGLTDQERLIAFWLRGPLVHRASDERNPYALVAEGPLLVPGKPVEGQEVLGHALIVAQSGGRVQAALMYPTTRSDPVTAAATTR